MVPRWGGGEREREGEREGEREREREREGEESIGRYLGFIN